jgi:hypothetical protein
MYANIYTIPYDYTSLKIILYIRIYIIYFQVHIIKIQRRLPENPSTLWYNIKDHKKKLI